MKRISEWVSLGHPDKTADFISEYLLDRYLEQDPNTRYAVEVQVKNQHVTLAGEVTSRARFSENEISYYVRKAIDEIGYTPEYARIWNNQCLNSAEVQVTTHINEQSPDIAAGPNNNGWGDQGIFFGYANDEEMRMPEDYRWARHIGHTLMSLAKQNPELGWGIDIKTQVTMTDDQKNPETIIIAIPVLGESQLKHVEIYVQRMITWGGVGCKTKIIVNGTGSYKAHSAVADCGTTGRKLVVDFYGGNCRVGGGSPWTKDGSKADLTLNLYAREIACAYAREHRVPVTTRLSCCIGRKEVDVTIMDTAGVVLDEYTEQISPAQLIERYGLKTPQYATMCASGLFGMGYRWDRE